MSRLWPFSRRFGLLLVLAVLCGGTEPRRVEAADGTSTHGTLTTTIVTVSKPSYPTVTTPVSTADPDVDAEPGRNSPPSSAPAFPSLATGTGGGSWCVASAGASPTALQVALDYACGYGADCSAIKPGGTCFDPDTVKDHASFAFNSYYQKNPVPTSCDFGGTATLTTTDPSSGSCQYPASSGGGQGQTTMPPPSPTMMPPTVPMTPTPTVPTSTPATTSPDTPTTGTPAYGMPPPDYGSTTSPPSFGSSTSPPSSFGSTSPPDYNDVGAAAAGVTGRPGSLALPSLLYVLVAAALCQHLYK